MRGTEGCNFSLRLRLVFNTWESEHAVYNPAEDDVLPIEKVAFCRGDEELASVRVWPGVCL